MMMMDSNPKNIQHRENEEKIRLQIELEFVQCLANPNYLNYLAQRGYFNDKTFINYLDYLQYWKRPEYSKFIKYPMCLHFLDLLQHEHFRRELTSTQCAKFIDDQILLHWQHYARKRNKLFNQSVQQQKQQQQSTTNSNNINNIVPNASNAASTNSSNQQRASNVTGNTNSNFSGNNNNSMVNGHLK